MTTLTRAAAVSRGVGRGVLATSTYNVVSTAAAGLAGIVIARSLGPSVRGEYAAIMAWYGLLVIAGGLGQPAATTYFVARDPDHGHRYVAASRTIMIASGTVILVAGGAAATMLASGATAVWGYRIMFAACLATLVGVTYLAALQGSSIPRWNQARISQPLGYLLVIVVLHVAGQLNLVTAMLAFAATTVAQTVHAYRLCGHGGLTGGRPGPAVTRPLLRYGAGQLTALVPLIVMTRLDQLILSLVVEPAVLGNYAVAVSLTTLAVPVAAGLGNVAFPRIAAQRGLRPESHRLQWWAVGVSVAIAVAIMLPLAVSAPWLVPMVFGPGFHDAVVLVAILAPGGVFLACQQVCADLLRGHGRPFAIARSNAVAAGLMVVLLAALLPVLGPTGAAIASSVSIGVAVALLLRALHRTLPAAPTRPGRDREREVLTR